MFHVRAKSQPRRRATPAIAALRLPIQSRGASRQTSSCASTVTTRNSLLAICTRLFIDCSMFKNMSKPTNRSNWISVGTLVSRVAARLVRDEEIGKGPAAAAHTRDNGGEVPTRQEQGCKVGVASGGGRGNAPRTEGRSVSRSGGRYSAHTELKFRIVGAFCAHPSRAIAYAPAQARLGFHA